MLPNYHDLLILDLAKQGPLDLKEALSALEMRVITARSEGDALSLFQNLNRPFLFAYAGSNQEICFATVKRLLKQPKFHRSALIIYGNGISSFHDLLNRNFAAAVTLDYPCEIDDLRDAVFAISARYDVFISRWDKRISAPAGENFDDVQVARFLEQIAGGTGDREVANEGEDLQQLLETFFQSKDKRFREAGGAVYRSGGNLRYWSGLDLYPADAEVRRQIEALNQKAGDWGALHLHRVAYMTNSLTQFLEVNSSLHEVARSAAFLFASGIVHHDRDLLKVNYLSPSAGGAAVQIGELVKSGVGQLSQDMELNFIAEVILALGKYLTKEEEAKDDPIALVASSILASDLVDRICWGAGYWNSRGAYFFMNNLKGGGLSHIHPDVVVGTAKFISEAVSAKSSAALVSRKVRENSELRRVALEQRSMTPSVGEQMVPINGLRPGMKLAAELKAYDGATLMPKDTVLDSDLIWRIWKLSAIRPINGPVRVSLTS